MLIRTLIFLCLLPFAAAAADLPAARVDLPKAADPAVRELTDAINAVRLVENRPLLRTSPRLMAAATAHAADMAERGYFAHETPDGRDLSDRLIRVGYPYALAMETIAAGERDPNLVLARWLDSPEHKRNLLSWNVRDIGVAHIYYPSDPALPRYRHYWVVVLGLAGNADREEIANANH